MIQVLFNSNQLQYPISSLEQLPEILAALEKSHLPEGSFIRDVLLDGESLVSDGILDLKSVAPERLARASNINVVSRTLTEVSREAIEGARTYLAGLSKPISLVALQFNSGQFEKAFGNLRILLDGISNLITLVGSLDSNFGLGCVDLVAQRATVRTHLEDLRRQLQELVQAQARQDTIAIADVLDYELKPRIAVWMEIFSTIQAKLDETSANSAT